MHGPAFSGSLNNNFRIIDFCLAVFLEVEKDRQTDGERETLADR